MKDFWNKRYAEKDYSYGKHPNAFFKAYIDRLKEPRKVLLPADGEGRNAVYAAKEGWEVTAFDYSESAQKKAALLASEEGVEISYTVSSAQDFSYANDEYDLIGLFYVHLPTEQRNYLFQRVVEACKVGGTIIIEAFSENQLQYGNSGGPKKLDMLYTVKELEEAFDTLQFIKAPSEVIVHLNEGVYHQGKASVVRMIGQK